MTDPRPGASHTTLGTAFVLLWCTGYIAGKLMVEHAFPITIGGTFLAPAVRVDPAGAAGAVAGAVAATPARAPGSSSWRPTTACFPTRTPCPKAALVT